MTHRVAFWRACWRASRRAVCAGAFALIPGSPVFAHHPGGASNTGGAGPIVTISASTLEAGHGATPDEATQHEGERTRSQHDRVRGGPPRAVALGDVLP